MRSEIHQFIAVKMDQFPALFTFAVKTDVISAVMSFRNVFKTSRAVGIDGIFINKSFIYHPFQMPVDRCLTDCHILAFKVFTDIGNGDMRLRICFQILQQQIPLFRLICQLNTHTNSCSSI